jgi:hypothetical protein
VSPSVAAVADETPPAVQFVERDNAFSFAVPSGWSADGRLQIEKPNNRYIVFNVTGPGDGLVFSGHSDLPQRYLVPGPWHGMLQPGRRTRFGEGPTAQYLFPGPLASAQQMCHDLASRRFGSMADHLARISAIKKSAADLLRDSTREIDKKRRDNL